MVIFLAGLQQVPSELYDAAEIDGAGAWRKFRSVTIPMITPVIFFNLVLGIINSFQAFTSAYIISGGTGGPSDSTLFYTLYSVPGGLQPLPHGLRLGDGLGAARHHRLLHRPQLPGVEPLGLLRGPLR